MGAIKDLFESERGLVAVVLAAGATVLLGIGRLTTDQWTAYTQWIFTVYVAGKTVTGAVTSLSTKAVAVTVAPVPAVTPVPEPAATAPKAA
jgi:hypothetical protein